MTPSPRAMEVAVKAIRDLRKDRKAALPFMPYGTSKPIMDKDLAETAITAYLAAASTGDPTPEEKI